MFLLKGHEDLSLFTLVELPNDLRQGTPEFMAAMQYHPQSADTTENDHYEPVYRTAAKYVGSVTSWRRPRLKSMEDTEHDSDLGGQDTPGFPPAHKWTIQRPWPSLNSMFIHASYKILIDKLYSGWGGHQQAL